MNKIIVFLLLLTLTACGAASSGNNDSTVAEGDTAVVLLTDMDSANFDSIVASYNAQGKAVLVNIWATWCGPCVEEFPHIVELQNKYADQLQVVFISADFTEDRERALEFLKEQNVTWETYFKTGKDEPFINAISTEWSGALPFTKIYNKNGEITSYWENKAEYDEFEKAILVAINPIVN
jgi:thiol-disulfide isomerase/thioredoxin